MAFILNIETSTTVCSVSVSENEKLICFKEINNGYTHAENLHVFIKEAIKEAGLKNEQLNAIAVSKGPGSYTGLRIGVSAAKGLAFALNIPLIAIDTLQAMAGSILIKEEPNSVYCPMLDARRMEVYTATYHKDLNQLKDTQALIVDENSVSQFTGFDKIYFFGDGMQKCKEILQSVKNAFFIDNVMPGAKNMCALSYKKYQENTFENVAYFEPFYLKDFLIVSRKN